MRLHQTCSHWHDVDSGHRVTAARPAHPSGALTHPNGATASACRKLDP
nr:hypothetical protein [Kibdelosporangium sp. MJ126-NF4]CTQ90014.1 hypothetical protein [Kibdelosporangium sp. MJ126-NF4]